MAWVAGMCFSLTASAQGLDEAPAKEKKAKPAAAKPAGGDKARPAGKPVNLAPPEDPVVTALLASNPTTPSEIFHTAQLLLEAGRPELAKRFLKKLLDAKLDDGQWTALVDEFHTPAFTDLAGRTELRPESEELIHAALSAVNRRLHDPARIAEQIKQLQDPSPEVRARALAGLQAAHGAGVNALIAVLADPQRAAEHAAVRAALVAMRGDAIDPLADIIERAEPESHDPGHRSLGPDAGHPGDRLSFRSGPGRGERRAGAWSGAGGDRAIDGSIAEQGPGGPAVVRIWRKATSPASRRCGSTSTAA